MSKKLWTKDETEYLVNNYSKLPVKTICTILGRTEASIHGKAKRIGIQKPINFWTLEEDTYLKEHYPSIGVKLCSKALGRSEGCINNRIQKLGLKSTVKVNNNISILNEWLESNRDIELLEEFVADRKPIKVRHLDCGYEWTPTLNCLKRSRTKGNKGCPKCAYRKQYSQMAINWLNSISSTILHAENGGEQVVAGYKVDGYDPINNIVYEFHGDVFHGNLDIFHPDYRCHPFNKNVTAEDLWQQTFDKMLAVSKVSKVFYIWEADYLNGKSYLEF